ncbi:unnamed protein product [Blepharisma stoltei]|uniref:TmcB/TmcC TPR repeats domain-containing protein n=1 Tax=Blepharisma stoltei TaxID=1481888 RepID=A0AAU9JDX3_9CILI|nr:unnamed protein product [Blepharisma stoltei]
MTGPAIEFGNTKNKFWETENENLWLDAIFETYRQLYSKKNLENKSFSKQKVKAVLEATIWCLQVAALIWIPNLPVKNWSGNIFIWEIMGYLRFDTTCVKLGIINECLYLSFLTVFCIGFGHLVIAFFLYKSFDLPQQIFVLFKKFSYLWAIMLFIPSMTLFSIYLKYNFSPEEKVLEYNSNNHFKDFEINTALQILIVFAMAISFFLILFYSELTGEIRHFAAQQTIKAKAHSRVDNHMAIFIYFLPIFYTIIAENHIIYYQLMIMLFSLFLMWESINYIPYFSFFCNSLLILRFFIIAAISFIFQLGYWVDNSLSIILFAIVLIPLSSLYFINFILKLQQRTRTNLPNNLTGINSKYQLEKALRHALCENDAENKDQIIYIFEAFFIEKTTNRAKLQVIWEINYCLHTLKDESLARAKLSKISKISDWSLLANYQAYLCKKNIEDSYTNESSKFLNYFQQLNWIKKEDKKLCETLLEFWKEVASDSPILNRLIRKLNFIDKNILSLSREYSQIITKFSNSRESLALYASYTRNILFDIEKGIMLDNKLRYFDRLAQNSTNDIRNFSFFDDGNGILIFSNEEENFGEILFANSAASETLKFTSLVGNSISNFVIPYYRKIFIEKMKWYAHFSSASEIDLEEGFFIDLPTHFLIECTGKASMTAINNFLITVLVFKLKPASHQVALISDDGEILGHTEDFSKYAKYSDRNLIGFDLFKIFNFEKFQFQPFIPYHLSDKILVFMYFEVCDVKISYILLINDPEEMQKWQDKALEQCSCPISPSYINNKRKSRLLENLGIPMSQPMTPKSQENRELNFDTECRLIINKSDENSDILNDKSSDKLDEKSQISLHTSLKQFLSIIKIFSRSINILHFVFVLSVLIVIATNIAVLFYAFSSIDLVSDMSLPLTVGEAGKNLQLAAYIAKVVLILSPYAIYSSSILPPIFAGLETKIGELENIHSYIANNLTSWDSCSGRSIVTDKNIDMWYLDNGIYREKTNLLDTLTLFIQTGKEFIRKYNTSEDFTEEAAFMIINGYGEAFYYCNHSMYDVIDCQETGINNFKSKMFILLVLGIAVLGTCILIMAPFCYSTLKIENDLWNNVRKSAYKNYFELANSSIDRLTNIHYQAEIATNDKKLSKKSFNFKNYWKYTWRIFIYCIIVFLFSLTNILYFYEKCADYLSYRPEVIRELLTIQTSYTNLGIWVTEISGEYTYSTIKNQLYMAYPFTNSESAVQKAISKIKYSEIILRDFKYSEILSKGFNRIYYENVNSAWNELATGIHSAGQITIYDSGALIYLYYDLYSWLRFLSFIFELDQYYSKIIVEVDKYSQSVIDDQIHLIMTILVLFIMISLVIYFGKYLIFFRNEKKYLMKINSMMKIIPQGV